MDEFKEIQKTMSILVNEMSKNVDTAIYDKELSKDLVESFAQISLVWLEMEKYKNAK